MTIYESAAIYIDSCTTLRGKITAIDNVIAALNTSALKAAATGNITEYSLDDGQTKIKATYRSPIEVSNSITAFEGIRQRYINQLNGRVVQLRDGKNFTRYNFGNGR
jgi:hypothetical protein